MAKKKAKVSLKSTALRRPSYLHQALTMLIRLTVLSLSEPEEATSDVQSHKIIHIVVHIQTITCVIHSITYLYPK